MDKKVKQALNEFVDRAKELDIERVILYGSAARGEYNFEQELTEDRIIQPELKF